MKKALILLLLLFSVQNLSFAQKRKPKPIVKDSLNSEAFLLTVEKTLESFYAEYAKDSNYDSIINALEYEPNQIPDFTDEEICGHLAKMSESTPFHLDCNTATINTIRFFARNRRSFIRIALGRSKLYFDLYEQALDKHDLPLELRFLSVIESGLRPQVKSPAGALGLWQFMYGTGKMYNLKENAYFDERMDPVKATDAACRYLKKLFDIYGDWNLALAAYNAGPGNINKAIRRSGGKKTYWEVRPFLPRETQGYVPNFIAAAYLMTYHAEHNLVPMEAKIHRVQLDTMCLRSGVHMETIAKLVDWPTEEIQSLNPIFKRTYIPLSSPNQCISGPLAKIGKLVALEDSLFKLEKRMYGTPNNPVIQKTVIPEELAETGDSNTVASPDIIYHKVRKGETLTRISTKYKVTNKQVMQWNNLRSTRVPVGKLLKIIPTEKESADILNQAVTESNTQNTTTSDSIIGLIYYDSLVTVYHLVQRNESLDVIAKIYNVKPDDIKTWNNLKDNWLNIDQKLLILTKIQLSKPGMVVRPKVTEVPNIPVDPKPIPPKKYYVIRSGDLFNRVAQRHGLTTAQLQKLNPGVNPDKIRVGQQVRIR